MTTDQSHRVATKPPRAAETRTIEDTEPRPAAQARSAPPAEAAPRESAATDKRPSARKDT